MQRVKLASNVKRRRKWILWAVAIFLIAGMVWVSFKPQPVDVDIARVTQGPLIVTIKDDGQTRIKERYVVSSPLAGRLSRIHLNEGAILEAGKTLIALIEPSDPQLLDARTRRQAEALVKTTEAGHRRAAAELKRAQSEEKFATIEWKRARGMLQENLISQAQFDQADYRLHAAVAGLNAAEMGMQMALYELEQAKAALLHVVEPSTEGEETAPFKILSPISGKLLRLRQESSVNVFPDTPLVEVGDPKDLEVIVDVLSSDAVKIVPGARVFLDHWGGEGSLNGVVRLVEPSAFTKISALGVEEQRVWVVIDFTDPWEIRSTLGDGYRVEPRIVIWEKDPVIKVPTGALFREGERSAVFVVDESSSTAELRLVERGRSDGLETEILSGLQQGETVIIHPSERVGDSVLIAPRD